MIDWEPAVAYLKSMSHGDLIAEFQIVMDGLENKLDSNAIVNNFKKSVAYFREVNTFKAKNTPELKLLLGSFQRYEIDNDELIKELMRIFYTGSHHE